MHEFVYTVVVVCLFAVLSVVLGWAAGLAFFVGWTAGTIQKLKGEQ